MIYDGDSYAGTHELELRKLYSSENCDIFNSYSASRDNIDAQWEGPPCPTIRVLSYSN